jgi:hypothetical protein
VLDICSDALLDAARNELIAIRGEEFAGRIEIDLISTPRGLL